MLKKTSPPGRPAPWIREICFFGFLLFQDVWNKSANFLVIQALTDILSPSCWRSPRTFNRGHGNSPGPKKVTKNRLCIARILFFHGNMKELMISKWLAFVPLYIPMQPISYIRIIRVNWSLLLSFFLKYPKPTNRSMKLEDLPIRPSIN